MYRVFSDLIAAGKICAHDQKAGLIVQRVVILSGETSDERVFGRKIKIALDGVLPVVEWLRQELARPDSRNGSRKAIFAWSTPGTIELPRSRVRSIVPKKNALSFLIGPPMEPPNCWRLEGGFTVSPVRKEIGFGLRRVALAR